eukprot:954944-Pelagomonas_calceolata.AAC.7
MTQQPWSPLTSDVAAATLLAMPPGYQGPLGTRRLHMQGLAEITYPLSMELRNHPGLVSRGRFKLDTGGAISKWICKCTEGFGLSSTAMQKVDLKHCKPSAFMLVRSLTWGECLLAKSKPHLANTVQTPHAMAYSISTAMLRNIGTPYHPEIRHTDITRQADIIQKGTRDH